MNIILLSGGSGKRLWPLSNDVRSKQFIKLFKDGENYESMVQRVYRQITTVDPNAKITIATSKSQASAIKNQLGEKASICVEPCRRDTFPAIALAATYLHDELGVGVDEAVVVCPVDPYVDNTYYEAVMTLQELAAQGGANLTLMGIEPTYPSEKYGYIIPESGDSVSRVKEFKEKPDTETAKKYLVQKALWNAGIFAFKLGYLLDKAHSMIDFEDYRDLFNKYDTLTKISFDYAVVEKEPSIQVLRYSGDWKDVGTWNMMAEVMADQTKGKVVLDEECENTNVVNELNIPILCMGCKDMIVAASGDGILISDKERSGKMKPYVEKIETEAKVTEEILRHALETGTLDKHLQKVEVHKGDTYFVPAGTIHGIGRGILIAEIQESSNVTYRVYDYDRVDKNGKKRELNFDKAVQVMDMNVAPDVKQNPRLIKHYPGCSRELLCRCKYFETERIQVSKGFSFTVRDESFQVLMCLDGYGQVETMDAEQKPMRFSKGETMFLPAGIGRCLVIGDATVLKIRC